ncbi:MAG: hypothetical protein HeimC2_26290 [Candidatus Heimdallarchaeota archaeon LC_2]|nr:MAG: hypothetical protein HeimC2_26290 [Candidatus Heimdallarchaeota archaeon LC_2]
MPRFSAKVKKIHDEIWYNTDIVKAKSLMKELKDPLDIAFGKLFISKYNVSFRHLDEFHEHLAEIENNNKRLEDKFIQFMINYNYCYYYTRVHDSIDSKEQFKKYLIIMEKSYPDIDYHDDWEKYYCMQIYYSIKASYEVKFTNNLSDVIKFHKLCTEASLKISGDGEYISDLAHNTLGIYYLDSGNFKEAEKSFQRSLNASEKYQNLWQFQSLGNLSWLNSLKGDLQLAKELNEKGLDIARHFKNAFGISARLTSKGHYLYQEGNYDEALSIYQESLLYVKEHGDSLLTFIGHFDIFNFYYTRFRVTLRIVYFEQAEEKYSDLQELSNSHSDNEYMTNYTKYAQALILKSGNLRKRIKAIDIFEELLKTYDRSIDYISQEFISLNLLELLLQDVLLSDDQDTIDQIDKLMEKLSNIPLRNNPQAVLYFTDQQIVLAKYNYYIKGDPSLAFQILNNAKDKIITYNLDNFVNQLDAEIRRLELEFTKWDNIDKSVKDRIKNSNFSNYIKEALNIADKPVGID